jgi:uncharacterized membrane protein
MECWFTREQTKEMGARKCWFTREQYIKTELGVLVYFAALQKTRARNVVLLWCTLMKGS